MCKKFEFGGNSHGDATILIPGPFAPGVCGVPQGAAGEASWHDWFPKRVCRLCGPMI